MSDLTTRYTMKGLTQICITATAVFVGVRAVMALGDVWLIWFVKQIESGALDGDRAMFLGNSFDAKMAIINIAFYVALGISLLLNAVWLYRASSNAGQFMPSPSRMGPGYAVGCYFIPIVQLFLPYKAMRETVNSSYGDGRALSARLPVKYAFWWGCWIIGSIGGQVLFRMPDPVDLQDTLHVAQLDLAVHMTFVMAGVLFITILRDVAFAQDNRAEMNTAVFE